MLAKCLHIGACCCLLQHEREAQANLLDAGDIGSATSITQPNISYVSEEFQPNQALVDLPTEHKETDKRTTKLSPA